MLAGLPYVVWPVGSLFILASRKKEDPYLHYHAVQGGLAGAVLGVLSLIAFLGLVLLFRIMPAGSVQEVAEAASWSLSSSIPGFLGVMLFAGGTVITLAAFLTAVFLGWRASAGEMLRLPFLGDYAEERMVDATGMTRRQFNQMLEDALRVEQLVVEEEIPFPEKEGGLLSPSGGEPAQSAQQPEEPRSRAHQIREAREKRQDGTSDGFRQGGVVDRALGDSSQTGVARSYPLISGQGRSQLSPSPPQRSPDPPRQASTPAGWQQQSPANWLPGANHGSGPPTSYSPQQQGQASPQVRDVDLIRHYQQRKGQSRASSQGGQQSDVLRQWLSKVDND